MQRECRFLSAVISIIVLGSFSLAQQRDPDAIAVLNQAQAAMGATAILSQFTSAECTGSIQAVDGSTSPSGTFVWIHQFSSTSYQFRSELTSNGKTQILVSGSSSPQIYNNGVVGSLPSQVTLAMYPIHLPVVVIGVFLANQNYAISLGSSTQINGVTANHVVVSIGTDSVSQAQTPEDWYFDPTSGLPLRVEYRLADVMDATQYTTAAVDYSNFQAVSAVLVPFSTSNTQDGTVVTTTTVTSVQWNYPIDPSDFMLTGN